MWNRDASETQNRDASETQIITKRNKNQLLVNDQTKIRFDRS